MTSEGAIRFFRNGTRLAKLLNLKRAAVYKWGKYPPELRQRQMAELSGGVLKIEQKLILEPLVEDYS